MPARTRGLLALQPRHRLDRAVRSVWHDGRPALRSRRKRPSISSSLAQDPTQGGWRYVPASAPTRRSPAGSSWRSRAASWRGLQCRRDVSPRRRHWLRPHRPTARITCIIPCAPTPQAQRHGRCPTPAMTAVGLLMRLYTGLEPRRPAHDRGPSTCSPTCRIGTAVLAPRHLLLVLRHAGHVPHAGRVLAGVERPAPPLLVDRQIQTGPLAGSWDPAGRWPTAGARRRPDLRDHAEPVVAGSLLPPLADLRVTAR